jgi:hypothetical protein
VAYTQEARARAWKSHRKTTQFRLSRFFTRFFTQFRLSRFFPRPAFFPAFFLDHLAYNPRAVFASQNEHVENGPWLNITEPRSGSNGVAFQ